MVSHKYQFHLQSVIPDTLCRYASLRFSPFSCKNVIDLVGFFSLGSSLGGGLIDQGGKIVLLKFHVRLKIVLLWKASIFLLNFTAPRSATSPIMLSLFVFWTIGPYNSSHESCLEFYSYFKLLRSEDWVERSIDIFRDETTFSLRKCKKSPVPASFLVHYGFQLITAKVFEKY